MKQLDEILANIREAVEEYEERGIFEQETLRECLKKLDCNLFYLASHRVKAWEEWIGEYNEYDGSNAAKERHADSKVPELYMFRKVDAKGAKISDGIRSQISSNNKEK